MWDASVNVILTPEDHESRKWEVCPLESCAKAVRLAPALAPSHDSSAKALASDNALAAFGGV